MSKVIRKSNLSLQDCKDYMINDGSAVLEFYYEHRNDTLHELAEAVMKREDWWGLDLTTVPTFIDEAKRILTKIEKEGMQAAIEEAAAK